MDSKTSLCARLALRTDHQTSSRRFACDKIRCHSFLPSQSIHQTNKSVSTLILGIFWAVLHHSRRSFMCSLVILILFITRLSFNPKPVNYAMAELFCVQSTSDTPSSEAFIRVYCLFDFTGYLIAHSLFSTTYVGELVWFALWVLQVG